MQPEVDRSERVALGPFMRQSIGVAAGTQLLPGTRIAFKDREDPRPVADRLKGSVLGLSLYFDGERLELDGVVVKFEDDGTGAFTDGTPEIFAKDELDQLEILP